MRRSDFKYSLPEDLIAQHPLPERQASRLLVLDGASGALADRSFTDIGTWLQPGDLLVLNDTRVIAARLGARKASGGKAEIFIERLSGTRDALAHIRASRSPKPGSVLCLDDGTSVHVTGRAGELFELTFSRDVSGVLESLGHMPLPPYIRRPDSAGDRHRYQTVFAREPGAVAAPTAGLHFDRALLNGLAERGVELAYVTLHVGSGTFAPMRAKRLEDHTMHSEFARLGDNVVSAVQRTRDRGGRVVAVGTTAVRTLESAAADGELRPFEGETRLFIYPGYRFRVVDAMITNFHLPESTLIMLVCAFAGTAPVLAAYQHAVAQRYRFFSFGDAMLVTPAAGATEAIKP